MSGHDDGHTIAGWTGTAVATAGASVLAVGVIGWTPGLWLGGAVTVAALLVTWGLHLAGWGKAPGPRPAAVQPMRVRDRSARGGHPGCLGCRLAGRDGAAARTGAPRTPAAALAAVTATTSTTAGATATAAAAPAAADPVS
ncbi:HGxxPAAW family protein [Streptomyces sp. cmx-4-9]|uniref:HGxxPAAW family protein n=1 Tax=Streptomyces sp. cmx-4-9 TaxID=2790941 RepID=UPI00397EE88A